MSFLQPFMFWGILAVAVPVIIHFWHQKKGRPMDWAAMRWLTDKNQQQSRGFRLDDLLLLIVRCILVLILVFLMARPVIDWYTKAPHTERIHLVEPSAYLADNFRFELETAIRQGEKVYWINPSCDQVKDLSTLPGEPGSGVMFLQDVLNKMHKPDAGYHVYLLNNQRILRQPPIYIPGEYTIHAAIDSSQNVILNHMDLGNGKKLFVHRGQLMTSDHDSENRPAAASRAIHTGAVRVLLDYKNQAERRTVEAALEALSAVYSIPFQMDIKKAPDRTYDFIWTDQHIEKINPETHYMISGKYAESPSCVFPNVTVIPDSLRIQTSEMVYTGQLPEFLGHQLIGHFKLDAPEGILSTKQLNAYFVRAKSLDENTVDNLRPWLSAVFLITLILERWMALRKKIQKSYA